MKLSKFFILLFLQSSGEFLKFKGESAMLETEILSSNLLGEFKCLEV